MTEEEATSATLPQEGDGQVEAGQKAPTGELKGPSEDGEHVRRLKSQYDRKIAELKKRLAQTEERLRELEAQELAPGERERYLRDHYQRQIAIYRAALEHGLPLEELEDVQTPEELQARVRLAQEKREIERKLREERQALEKERERLASEIAEQVRKQVLEALGLEGVVRAQGSPGKASDDKERKKRERFESLKKSGRGDRLYEGLRIAFGVDEE